MTAGGRKGYSHHRVRPVPAPARRRVDWNAFAITVLILAAVAVATGLLVWSACNALNAMPQW